MKLVFFILIIFYFEKNVHASIRCNVPSTPSNTAEHIHDYYWRDYVGIIPLDAIPGGTDPAGNPTYIGQVYIKNYEMLPGTIYSGCRSATVSAYGQEMSTDKNIKILCSTNLHKYSWIATKNEESHLLTNCHFVIGGSEIGQTLNIGRVNHDGQTVVGKVFSYPLPNRGLWIPNNGGELNLLSYELLTYNCHSPSESDKAKI